MFEISPVSYIEGRTMRYTMRRSHDEDLRRTPSRWVQFVGWAVLTLIVTASGTVDPVGDAFVVDFEDYPANGPGQPATDAVTDFYAEFGVLFNAPNVLDHSQGLGIEGFAHSGSAVAVPCYAQEFCNAPVRMEFADPQVRVGVWVGYADDLEEVRDVVLIAYGPDGDEIDRVGAPMGPTTEPIPVDTYLEIGSPFAVITAAEVRWDDASFESNGLAVDDVTFAPRAPGMEISPSDVIDFGDVPIDIARSEGRFAILNSGNADLMVQSIELAGSEVFEVDQSCIGATLLPTEGCEVVVALSAVAPGEFAAVVAVVTSAGERLLDLVATVPASVTIAPDDVTTTVPPPTAAPTTEAIAPVTTQDLPVTTAADDEIDDSGGVQETPFGVVVLIGMVLVIGLVGRGVRRLRKRTKQRDSVDRMAPSMSVRIESDAPDSSLEPNDPRFEIAFSVSDGDRSERWRDVRSRGGSTA